jgi:hypothetical protein
VQRYYVTRIGSATLVVPAGTAEGEYDLEARAAVIDPHAEVLATLADPVVLGQAVEAGYIDAEAELHVSNDAEASAHDAGA